MTSPERLIRTYCTYFDSNYIVKVLALIESLNRLESKPFRIFAVCLDEVAEQMLNHVAPPNTTPLPLAYFERDDADLLDDRNNRDLVEYYRTLTPTIILSLLQGMAEGDSIIYLDADLFFFSSPDPIFEEFSGNSVMLHGNNFSSAQKDLEVQGKYNIGLLCFRNDEQGIRALTWWRDRCKERYGCAEEGKYDYQLCLNDWPTRFLGVGVLKHPGAGVAPWNHEQFKFSIDSDEKLLIDGKPLIFYHFHTFCFMWPDFIIPVKHLKYTMTIDVLQLVFLPYLRVLQSTLSLLCQAYPDLISTNSFELSQSHICIVKKGLVTKIREAGVAHPVFSLDSEWDYFLSGQMLPPKRHGLSSKSCHHSGYSQAGITIATSIGPSDIEKQRIAVTSWIKLGFHVLSINTAEEITMLEATFPDVCFVTAKRTGQDFVRKQLVFLDDVLAALEDCGSQLCGIINSDIVLADNQFIADFILNSSEQAFICGTRVDVISLDILLGVEYIYGRDYFFFNREIISRLPASYFCIGAPWWDLWLPLVAIQAGCHLIAIEDNIAFHKMHSINWDITSHDFLHILFSADICYRRHPAASQLTQDATTTSQLIVEYLVKHTTVASLTAECYTIRGETHCLQHPAIPTAVSDGAPCLLVTIPKQCSALREKVPQKEAAFSFYTASDQVKISIVTPSFNQAEYLEECIDSILGQNYPNLEYIIMDGGSTDGSVEIIKKYSKHLAYWQSKADAGQYPAINEGFSRSTGTIMAWLNSDDKYHSGALWLVSNIFESYPLIEWIMGIPTFWDRSGALNSATYPPPSWSRKLYLQGKVGPPHIQQESTFWRRDLWERAGGKLDTTFAYAADMELWSRFFRHTHLHTVDTMLGGFRSQPNQKTAHHRESYNEEAVAIIMREQMLFKSSNHNALLEAPPVVTLNDVVNRAHSRITSDNFGYFTYSRTTHFPFFAGFDLELYGITPNFQLCDLKVYQDLLVLTFIRQNIPSGSRLLEIGGGDSRLLNALQFDYECWNLDKLEGLGNGPVEIRSSGYKMIRDYIGKFNHELKENYFDFVFSISVFEHIEEREENFRAIIADIDRVLKPNGLSLHCFDVVAKNDTTSVWTNTFLNHIFKYVSTANKFIPLQQIYFDPYTYVMSQNSYEAFWQPITKVSYQQFGFPLSYNVLWRKE